MGDLMKRVNTYLASTAVLKTNTVGTGHAEAMAERMSVRLQEIAALETEKLARASSAGEDPWF